MRGALGQSILARRSAIVAIGVAALALTACKSGPSAEDYALQRSKVAEGFVQDGKPAAALEEIASDLTGVGSASEPARKFVASHPDFSQKLIAELDSTVRSPKDKADIFKTIRVLKAGKQTNMVSDAEFARLMSQTDARAIVGNADDSLDFLLSDTLDDLPGLRTPDAQKLIFKRSLAALSAHDKYTRSALVPDVFNYAAQRGPGSSEYTALKSALPKLDLSRSEIEGSVAKVFPDYAKATLASRTITVVLQFDPPDRVLEEDVKSALAAKSKAISIVAPQQKSDIVVTVGKHRYDERAIPERRETVAIAQYNVNLLAAALLMPRNASYLYDYTTGGAEIEYAFSVKAVQANKTIADDLLRNTVSRSYSSCSNYRIQNVFGGVQPANFMANDQMQAQCSGSRSVVRPSDLRQDVIDALVAKIAAVPPIAKMIEFGS